MSATRTATTANANAKGSDVNATPEPMPNAANNPNLENVADANAAIPAKRGRKPKAPVLGDATVFLLVVGRNGTTETEMFDSYNDAMAGVGKVLGDIASIDRATLVEVTGTKPIFQHERTATHS